MGGISEKLIRTFGRRDLELPWEKVEEKAVQLTEASKVFL